MLRLIFGCGPEGIPASIPSRRLQNTRDGLLKYVSGRRKALCRKLIDDESPIGRPSFVNKLHPVLQNCRALHGLRHMQAKEIESHRQCASELGTGFWCFTRTVEIVFNCLQRRDQAVQRLVFVRSLSQRIGGYRSADGERDPHDHASELQPVSGVCDARRTDNDVDSNYQEACCASDQRGFKSIAIGHLEGHTLPTLSRKISGAQ